MIRSVVEFASYDDMKSALDKLDGTELNGRKIKLIEDRKSHRYVVWPGSSVGWYQHCQELCHAVEVFNSFAVICNTTVQNQFPAVDIL